MVVQVDIPENIVKQRALFLDMVMGVNAFVFVPNISAILLRLLKQSNWQVLLFLNYKTVKAFFVLKSNKV